jgi:OOP family OmpA-OmpF porin
MPIEKGLFAAVAVLMLGGNAALAQDRGFYLGGGIGKTKANNAGSCSDLDTVFLPGFSCSSNDTSTGWKLFAGYQFNRYFAAEAGYVDLGNFKISASGNFAGPPFPPGPGTASGSDKAKGFSFDAVGTLPINEQFGLIGRIGVLAWTLDASTNAAQTNAVPTLSVSESDKATGTGLDFGVGVKYDFDKNIGVRAEFQRFKSIGNDTTGKSDIDLISVGILYRLSSGFY